MIYYIRKQIGWMTICLGLLIINIALPVLPPEEKKEFTSFMKEKRKRLFSVNINN